MPTFVSRSFTCRRSRIRTLPASPASATVPLPGRNGPRTDKTLDAITAAGFEVYSLASSTFVIAPIRSNPWQGCTAGAVLHRDGMLAACSVQQPLVRRAGRAGQQPDRSHRQLLMTLAALRRNYNFRRFGWYHVVDQSISSPANWGLLTGHGFPAYWPPASAVKWRSWAGLIWQGTCSSPPTTTSQGPPERPTGSSSPRSSSCSRNRRWPRREKERS